MVKAFLAIAILMCASSVQVSFAGTRPRNDWNKTLIGNLCTISSGPSGISTPKCVSSAQG
jgi:hypothetical protein